MKYETFALELSKTAAVFGTAKLSTVAIDAYWEVFEHEDDQDFIEACRRARADCDFMPTICQLRAFIPQGRKAEAETNRWLAQNAAARPKSWPRLPPSNPTSVSELLEPWMQEPGKVH